MKSKSKINHDQLLAEGVVHYGYDSKGNLWEKGKLVASAKVDDPIKPAALDVVARPTPTNPAPKITDTPPRKMPPSATGLQRAINANVEAQGGKVSSPKSEESSVTGLQRAINANIAAQKKA